ncbi:GAF domain-containing SpoIIE family protein phosphatase [Salinispira pacifica]|uniref:Serine phosphatase n=1 Tax=Salinispira pacifica TaxID=1307761 RepID=V5WL59_9SPIO|nr:GAF domain-containing SpoIIE family protein phosphatase [Salinispira pacifica]AHC16547.1 serine phosphatase [Salinispira pacifica]
MSLIDFISGVLSGSAWVRLIMVLFLWVITAHVDKKYIIPHIKWLKRVPLILLIREIAALFYFTPSLFYFSDALILTIYMWWLHSYAGNRKATMTLTLLNLGILIPILALAELFPSAQLIFVAADLHVAVFIFLFFIQMSNVSVYNTEEAGFIIQNRASIFLFMIFARVALLFDASFSSVWAQTLLLPLSIVPYMFYFMQYDLYFYALQKESEEFNNQYLNSLFDFMQTIGTAMTERIEVKAVLEYVMQAIVQYTDAEAGVVLLKDNDEGTLNVTCREGYFPPPYDLPQMVATKIASVETYFESSPIHIGETVLGQVAMDNEAVFIRNTVEDGRMTANIKENTMFISSLIAIPLIVNNEVFGVVSVIHRQKRQLFSELDYERCKVFVEYASLTLDSLYNYSQLLEKQEIEREVNIAGEIQKKLLPGRLPKRIREAVTAWSQPAKGVSGDYYDIITLNRAGKLGMVICDVAGKGVPASLIMVMIRTIIHLVAGSTQDASKVVSWINRGIAGRIDIERFATLSYITYDPNTQRIEYSNAAHHPLVILRHETGEIEKLDSKGLPIGLEREARYERVGTTLSPGDAVLLYTDGIVEAMNPDGEQYEEERLQDVFREHANRSSSEIMMAIRSDIEHFVGPAKQHDDQTLIVMKA